MPKRDKDLSEERVSSNVLSIIIILCLKIEISLICGVLEDSCIEQIFFILLLA